MAETDQLVPLVPANPKQGILRADLLGTSVTIPQGVGTAPQGLTPAAIVRAFKRVYKFAVPLGLLAGILGSFVVWKYIPPPKPRISARLLIDFSPRGTLFEHPDSPQNHQTLQNIIKSEVVITAALRSEAIRDLRIIKEQAEPADWLANEIVVDYPSGGEILRISMLNENTKDAIEIVNAVKNAYLEEFVHRSAKARRQRIDRLQQLQATAQENLKRKQNTIRRLAETVGSTRPENVAIQQQVVQEQLATAQRELIKSISDLRRLGLEETLRASGPKRKTPSAKDIEDYLDGDPTIKDYTAQRGGLLRRLQDAERLLTADGFAQVRTRLQNELDTIDTAIKEARIKAKDVYLKTVDQKQEIQESSTAANIKEQMNYQQELKKVLESEIERLSKSVKNLNTANLDLEAEKIEIQIAENLYSQISTAISTALAEQDAPVRVSHLENARVERVNLEARRLQMSSIAGIGLCLGICGLFTWLEYRKQRLETLDQLRSATDVPLINTIPYIPSVRANAALPARSHWQSVMNESMASTQLILNHNSVGVNRRIILVTSAEPREGKSLVVSQLALSYARAGLRTLIIDGDLRLPSMHKVFSVSQTPGFAEILRGQATDAACITKVGDNLFLLPAGQCDAAALDALAANCEGLAFNRFLNDYDVILIDSSPILQVADSLYLANHVQGVLLTVRQDYSRITLLREVTRRLRGLGAPIMGLVLNAYSENHYHGTYGYGYQRAGQQKPVTEHTPNSTQTI